MTNIRNGFLLFCSLSLLACGSTDKSSTSAGGLAGPAGPQGSTGPAGLTGPIGLTGLVGSQGVAGNDGVTGLQGPQGIAGINGVAGSQGLQGIAGPNGGTGPQGLQGIQGPQGIAGPAGGGSGGGLAMKDSTGATVKYTTQFPGAAGITYMTDANGYFWYFNAGQSTSGAALQPVNVWYLDTECSGTAYVLMSDLRFARMPFRLNTSADTSFHVLPDAAGVSSQEFGSTYNYSCYTMSNSGAAVLLSATVPGTAITAPVLSQPLHVEIP